MRLFSSLGPLEIIFIVLIGIIVLGPEDTVKAGKTLGKFMSNVVTSQWWRNLQESITEFKNLPYKLMREANIEELKELEALKKDIEDLKKIPNEFILENKTLNELKNELEEDLSPLDTSSWRGYFQYQTPQSQKDTPTTPDTEK